MSDHYVLDGHTPERATLQEWAHFYEKREARRVALTKVDGVEVSTVFLGLDHNFGGGAPILFETLVFGGPLNDEMGRYCTWEEAEEGHRQMVARVQAAAGG